MAELTYFTFHDAVQHITDFSGSDSGSRVDRIAKRAVAAAYRDLAKTHRWSYYRRRGRVPTVAPYDTGTVTYDHTGGAHERMLTLASGTWPSWAASGFVTIASVHYRAEHRISDSIITLDSVLNPGADVAAGTSYALFRDTYTLPADWRASSDVSELNALNDTEYVTPAEWLEMFRGLSSPSTPLQHTYIPDPQSPNRMAIAFAMPPSAATNYDFVYDAIPLPVRTEEYTTGSVATSGATITGTTTAFTARHVGAVIRFGDSVNVPDGLEGTNPFVEERVLKRFISATSFEMDRALTTAASAAKFRISDIIDIDTRIMQSAFQRLCELQYAIQLQRDKTRADVELRSMLYEKELRIAMGADDRDKTRVLNTSGGDAGMIMLRDIRDYSSL